ncbi:MAG: cyclopropane-fatty-acyl-phospholipid synthase family protein [Actinomycetota bacterium]|nr:cyclopropane-fatty-acyl-phospholipid synthase family protein [Actinomycetota bacterium]
MSLTTRPSIVPDLTNGVRADGRGDAVHRDTDRGDIDLAARAARAAIGALARRYVRWGRLRIIDDLGVLDAGPGGDEAPDVTVRVLEPGAYTELARHGSVGLGDGYTFGWWDTDDLPGLVRILARTIEPFDQGREGLERRLRPVMAPLRVLRASGERRRQRDRENIGAHYDVGNDFFRRILDETLTYSAALFGPTTTDLADAQRAKLDRLCDLAEIGPDDHVLEIGTGWGSFALRAASERGCRVTTTTISAEQHRHAVEAVAAAGLADRVTVLEADWRDLSGTYDKIVSVEMIEAVDHREHAAFLKALDRLVRPDGLVALQAITIADQRYERAKHTDDFIKSRIFPGGCLPSVARLVDVATTRTALRPMQLDDLTADYAETLRRWRANLDARSAEIVALGYPDEFVRLFRFYFAYCEAAFTERRIGSIHLVLAGPERRVTV